MNIEEANARLKNKITEKQLWGINSLYILLDLDKDDFCKIVDTVGIEKLIKRQKHYDRLDYAEQELSKKEKFLSAKKKLKELNEERERLEEIIKNYEE